MLEWEDMPVSRTTTTEEGENKKPRAPRRRVAKSAEDSELVTTKPRAPRRRVTKEAVPAVDIPVAEPSLRRAPTPLREQATAKQRRSRSLTIVLCILALITGGSIFYGVSDQGQIDVVAVVNDRNERINRGEVREGESTLTIPVQNNDIRPNGGLVPADPSLVAPPPPQPEATPTSSSEAAATTSDAEASESEAAPAATSSEGVTS